MVKILTIQKHRTNITFFVAFAVVHRRTVNDGSATRPGTTVIGCTTMRCKKTWSVSTVLVPVHQRRQYAMMST